jgi:hypothetical protein
LRKCHVPSGEKVSVFRIELQQGRERLLYWSVFWTAPIPAVTVGQKWYFLGQALFGSRPVDAAVFVSKSKSKEDKDPRWVVGSRVASLAYPPLSGSFIEQTPKRLKDQIGKQIERIECER